MLNLVRDCVASYVARNGGDCPPNGPVLCVDATAGEVDGAVFIFFDRTGTAPAIVAKAARSALGKLAFSREMLNLDTLQRIGMNGKQQSTPLPLDQCETDGCFVTLQSGLPGTLMKNIPGTRLFSPRQAERTIDVVLSWWDRFQNSFGVKQSVVTDLIYEREVLEPLSFVESRFILTDAERRFLDTRCRQMAPLRGCEIPLMARHGDFCTGNMFFEPDRITVFDWELPLEHRMPLFDLFYLFSSTRYPFRGIRRESSHFHSFATVYFSDDPFARTVRRRIREVAARFGITPDQIPDLLLVALLQVAVMKYEALLSAHGMTDEPGGHPTDNTDRLSRWQAFQCGDKDGPFSRVRGGVFENLRLLIENVPPRF